MKKIFRISLIVLFALSCLIFSCCRPSSVCAPQSGSAWHSGTGIPDISVGAPGDYYLDFGSGSVYEKTQDGWVIRGNLHTPSAEQKVKITFDPNGGELPSGYVRETSVNKGDALALPIPVREGYRFLGWFYGDGVNGGQANDLTVFSRDILLTAQWHKLPVLTVKADEERIEVGVGVSFTGEYDGTDAAEFTLFIEKDGTREPAANSLWISQQTIQFTAENGTLRGTLTFSAAGDFRVVLRAEENGEQAEASFTLSVKEAE